ncbi:MAG TPA: cellulase family glycosylhydrolase [Anaerolineae bacterium]|nr:cellulase family glycosylhydrolase [Anaerolineae bacterium]
MTEQSNKSGNQNGLVRSRGFLITIGVLGAGLILALALCAVAIVTRLGSEEGEVAGVTSEPTLVPTFTARVAIPTTTPTPDVPTEPSPTAIAGDVAPTAESPTVAAPTQAAPTDAAPTQQAPTGAAPAATATSAPPTSPPPSSPVQMASPDYGIQAFLWWRPEVAHRDLGLVKDAGFTWVKQWFAWRDIEGQGKGKYDWSTSDRIVQQADEFGLKLIVRVDHEPTWAGSPPGNINHFGDFLSAMATRYRGRIAAYQIWNEPNLKREWGNKAPNAGEYTQMLKKAYQVIKAADPNAIIVSAGMAPTTELSERAVPDTRFIQSMYDAGAKPYFDMLGAHGAGYKAPPEMDPGQVATDPSFYNVGDVNCPGDACRIYCFRHVEDLRQIMVRNGDQAKKVVVLEFGWTRDERTNSPYYWHRVADQFVQGDYMKRAYAYAKANWQPWIGVMSLIYMPDAKWTMDEEQFWWSVIEPSPDEIRLKAPYVILCSYIREQRGLGRCPWAPE